MFIVSSLQVQYFQFNSISSHHFPQYNVWGFSSFCCYFGKNFYWVCNVSNVKRDNKPQIYFQLFLIVYNRCKWYKISRLFTFLVQHHCPGLTLPLAWLLVKVRKVKLDSGILLSMYPSQFRFQAKSSAHFAWLFQFPVM